MIIKSQPFEEYRIAGQTGDFFPHHMDAAWCATQPFGQRIAHGTLVFSVAIGMTASEINTEAISKGYDRLRFIKPVFIGDTITVTVTITDCHSAKRPDYGQITEQVEVHNQHKGLVLSCAHLLVVKRKASAERHEEAVG